MGTVNFTNSKKNRLLALLLLLALQAPVFGKTPGEVEEGNFLRNAELRGLNGPNRKFSDFLGKPLIVNVWASWCSPCRSEMGSLDKLAKRFGGKQINIIGISTDDNPKAALQFLQQSGTSFPNFSDAPPWPLENMLGANRLPLTVLIDANGKVVSKHYGARQWDAPNSIEAISKTFRIGSFKDSANTP